MNENVIQKIFYGFLILSFFLGTWHAFPMLNVVADEMYYVGGVLRAMESHTILPLANDVPYGTLTYFLNYGMSVLTITLLSPFFGFSISAIKLFLIQSPSIMYFSLRILSAMLAIVMLFVIDKLLKKEIADFKVRLFLLSLLFGNIIVSVILHTGKMWVLSTLLVILSFYYLNDAIKSLKDNKTDLISKKIFLSIFFAFLAVTNFPLNFYCFIAIPILFFYFRHDKSLVKKIILYSLIGGLVYVAVTLLNFEGIKNQIISIFTGYRPLVGDTQNNLSFFGSFKIYILKTLILFPLLILTLVISLKDRIRNKSLFVISVLYFTAYFLLIVWVANWTSDLRGSLRYLFPLPFFLIFIIASFNIRFKKIFFVIGSVSLVFHIFTIYYLSVPTTYNRAYVWVNEKLADKNITIINEIPELQLQKNRESSLQTSDMYCASKCKNIIAHDLNREFKPLVIDYISKEDDYSNGREIYYVKEVQISDPNFELLYSFTNPGKVHHSVEYNVGSYFDANYIRLNSLGKNIFIYRKKN